MGMTILSKLIDLTGKRYGHLTVVKKCESSKSVRVRWTCICDCGKTTTVLGENLKRGNTKSCGCIRNKHLMSYSKLYGVWRGMIERCENKNRPFYHRYGGRGISVCQEWRKDFTAFMKWSIENGYSDGLTIDRIDNDGDYSPNNCRWATMKTQRNNASTNINLTYNGRTMNVTQWAEELKVSRATLYSRIRKGWSDEETLSIPVTKENSRKSFRREKQ